MVKPPREWRAGRLQAKVASAVGGSRDAGLDLLGMAARQLIEHRELEPDLIEYLAIVLLNVTQNPPERASEHLNIAKVKNTQNRPRNVTRTSRMIACWLAACDAPLIDRGDESNLRTEAIRIQKIQSEPEKYAKQLVEWDKERNEAMRLRGSRSTSDSTYKVAAGLFNHLLADSQKHGERFDEKPVKPSAIKSAVNRSRQRLLSKAPSKN